MDKLGKKLVSIENKLGGSEPVPSNVQDKLGWHLDYIESLIEGGGGGGSMSTPIFDVDITEESGKIVVSMSEEDKNDIYNHKYPIIGIHVIDEEESSIVLYFKLRIQSDEANAIVYDNWDGGDGEVSQLELTFVWDGDDTKVLFETHDYSIGGDLEFATNNDIDALFEEPEEDVLVESIEFTNLPEDHSIELNVGDVVDMSQYIEVSPSDATDKSYTLTTDAPSVLSINGTTITVLQGAEGLNANLTVTANDDSGCSDIMIVDILNGEEPDPEEDIPIQSIRYTDGQGQTCIGFNMLKGEQVDLWTNLEINPSDATEGVEFMSDDDGIVQVDGTGIATATGEPGESTTITMSSMGDPTIFTTIEISISEEDEPDNEEE